MSRMRTLGSLVVAGLITVFAANSAMAQGGGGGRGGDFAQMMQQREERMKQSLGVTEDEWKVLQPKIQSIRTQQMQAVMGRMGGMRSGRGGGGGGNPPPAPTTEVGIKAEALSTALADKEAKPEDIVKLLADLRAARDKARQDIAKAQADLKQLLTPRQEAQLVVDGVLD